jgi:hypothetical protein
MIDFKLFRKYFIIIFLASLCLNLSLNAKVKGKVVDIYGEPVEATIYSLLDRQYWGSVRTVSGEFEIEARILLVIPNDTNHVPGYYQEGEIATLEFQYATDTYHSNTEDIEIVLNKLSPTSGTCSIFGTISIEEYPLIERKGEETQNMEDTVFVFLYVLNSKGVPVKYIKLQHKIWYAEEPQGYIIDGLDTGDSN